MISRIYNKIKTNNFWKTLLSNTFSAFVGDSGAALINLIIVVILIKLIGDDGYGILVLSQSYMLIMEY